MSDGLLSIRGVLGAIATQRSNPQHSADLRLEQSDAAEPRPEPEVEPPPVEAAPPHIAAASVPVRERQMDCDSPYQGTKPVAQDRSLTEEFERLRDLLGEVMTKVSRLSVAAKNVNRRVGKGEAVLRAADQFVVRIEECSSLLKQWRGASGV